MTVITRNDTSPEDFERQLREDLWHRNLSARTAVIRAGPEIYKKMVRREEDGPRTLLPGVGFIGIELDQGMEPWSAEVVERGE